MAHFERRAHKWTNTTDSKLRDIKEDIKNWNDGSCRKEQVILIRLRIGHTRLTCRKPGSGRPRCTSERDDRFIISKSLRNRHPTRAEGGVRCDCK